MIVGAHVILRTITLPAVAETDVAPLVFRARYAPETGKLPRLQVYLVVSLFHDPFCVGTFGTVAVDTIPRSTAFGIAIGIGLSLFPAETKVGIVKWLLQVDHIAIFQSWM